ncbi:GNAT family N-acetyltransferase [Ningiella sp. W23]|uniref:GNAT family N-acetyltransferase n=1 Tax=Ningiella sp. W23 TaxID=3023715 RepID=UPI003757A1A4
MQKNKLTVLNYSSGLSHYFDSINRQWLEEMFVVEPIDDKVLKDPQTYIIEPGGAIWFVKHETLGIVGTCALLNKGDGYFELTKMGVLANCRGLKIGETLLQHVLEFCSKSSLPRVFLLTSTKCKAAIHLYEKLGFTHSAFIMQKFGSSYERCDVAMELSKETQLRETR